jgi:hypothetical protein
MRIMTRPSSALAFTFVVLGAAAALAGCGTNIDYIPLNTPPHPMPPRSPESVELFTTSPPQRPYVEVGAIESQQQSMSTDNVEDIYAKMRIAAADRGCDGLVIVASNDSTQVSGSTTHGNGSVSSRTLKGYRATCIVFTDAPPSAPATAPAAPAAAPPPVAPPAPTS